MSSVSERVEMVESKLKATVGKVRTQLVGLEKTAEERVAALETQAKASFGPVLRAQAQLQRAWATFLDRVRHALALATRAEIDELTTRISELTSRVEVLLDQAGTAIEAQAGKVAHVMEAAADAAEDAAESVAQKVAEKKSGPGKKNGSRK